MALGVLNYGAAWFNFLTLLWYFYVTKLCLYFREIVKSDAFLLKVLLKVVIRNVGQTVRICVKLARIDA